MSTSLRPGDGIDRYTVESLLGEGGMATVYAVRHRTLGSSHALKLLKMEGDSIRERLVAEGQVQAALRHPNIVAVTDVLVVGGRPALLMERVDGPSLAEWLEENRPELGDALKLFRGILAGVARAHRAGLVHRDLKPGNVLLDGADGLVIPKVADFGLAKMLAEDPSHSQTRTGFPMGTPQYMAPEQIRNAKDVDRRADVFALGCILYVLVCGRAPFEAPDVLELYNRIATGRYQPPQSLVPGLPDRVRETIAACLEVDREKRPADCDAVRALLYGADDDALAGGVKLSGGSVLRPARRAEHLVTATTRHDGSLAATRPDARPAATFAGSLAGSPPQPTGSRAGTPLLALGFAVGASFLALGMAGLVAVLAWPRPPGVVGDPAPPATAPASASPDPPIAPAPAPGPTPPTTTEGAVARRPSPASAKPTAAPAEVLAPRQPEPAPSPAPPSASAAPDPGSGRVTLVGSVDAFRLRRGTRTWSEGEVPAGVYEAEYRFSGKGQQTLPGVTVRAGEETVIVCNSAFAACRAR